MQPLQFDTKTTSEKNSYLDEGWLFIGSFKTENLEKLLLYVALLKKEGVVKRVGKCSNTFDQLLIYWKIRVSRNNLQVYIVWFLIYFFKLSSITNHLSSILRNNCNSEVITPGIVFED